MTRAAELVEASEAGSTDDAKALPRLLYIGDVPVENTFAGAIYLYRLLRNYPADKLLVYAPVDGMVQPLPGVRYVAADARWPRLLHTRFASLYCAWITWRLNSVPRRALDLVSEFKPQAVLTISQTGGWLLAWRIAEQEGLPLIMLAHDDHAFYRYLPRWLQSWAQRRFAQAFRFAAERFCISDAMAESYRRRFGVRSRVLQPLRSAQSPDFSEPAGQTLAAKAALTFVYAGSVHGEPSLRQIVEFGRAAASQGHRLVVYSPQHASLRARADGIAGIEVREPVGDLIGRLREEADCLLVVGSFDAALADVVNTQFPSKAADYSAVGVPLLVWAPKNSSIALFVDAHAGSADLVTDVDPGALAPVIARLASSPEHRFRLAKEILEVGRREFSPGAAWKTFTSSLLGAART
jgi:glycosyltransferase involved in cell wall biosynthesis